MGHGAIVGGEINAIGDAFGGRVRYADTVAAIVLGRCTNVPAVNTVTVPGAADGRGFMDKDLIAGWCKGASIDIVGAVELGFGKKARVDTGWPEKIECGSCLGNEAGPQMDGTIRVNAVQAGKEMTFPSVDRFFGGVSVIDVGRQKLVVNRDGLHVAFEAMGIFVVQYL